MYVGRYEELLLILSARAGTGRFKTVNPRETRRIIPCSCYLHKIRVYYIK